MINEKISLRIWIEAAADQGVPLHTYLLKLSSEELELSEDAILEQMQAMLQVMEESAAFGLTGVSSHSGLTGGDAMRRWDVSSPLLPPEPAAFCREYFWH